MPELQKFAKNIWIAEGPQVRDMGAMFTTRMTIVRLADGSLWISSPVHFDKIGSITTLGDVKHLVAGTPRHVWRLEAWHTKFPDAKLWVTPQVLNRFTNFIVVGKKGQRSAGILHDAPPRAWARDFDQLIFRGNLLIEEVIFFHKKSHTVILDDLIQSHPLVKGRFLHNSLLKLGGVASPGGVPVDMKLTFFDRDLARGSLDKLLSWDFDKLIIAHGLCIEKNARHFVEQAFRWLR